MTPPIVAVLAIGGLLGLRHAFEPDHLAAVSTLATRPGGRRLWSAARLGLIWGLGHTVTVGAVALVVLVLGVQVPATLWPPAGWGVRAARRVADLVGARAVGCRPRRAVGGGASRRSGHGERRGGCSSCAAGDRRAVAIMTFRAAGAGQGV